MWSDLCRVSEPFMRRLCSVMGVYYHDRLGCCYQGVAIVPQGVCNNINVDGMCHVVVSTYMPDSPADTAQ